MIVNTTTLLISQLMDVMLGGKTYYLLIIYMMNKNAMAGDGILVQISKFSYYV
jgi:hypothetical protein